MERGNLFRYLTELGSIPVAHVYHWGPPGDKLQQLGPFTVEDFMESESRGGILKSLSSNQSDPANLLNISEPELGLVCKQAAGVVLQLLGLEFPGITSSPRAL
ncbi:hypothetical protein INS49_010908 [Diaporthe citri]|uniref:uncharacterized protein n=1 Tax=Diaporthe citri TaxID=83186 RepID=UPI001C7FC31A|nr:uncharacterized protein INS49_010908 [Diaporthe citri]KAG6359855.1 hypothetical protein INS49_010908 [Diaporthe citri]